MLAALKNGVIDGAMAVEPTQTAAVTGLKIAKMMVDVEGGGAPLFKEYAYNGMCSCARRSSRIARRRRAASSPPWSRPSRRSTTRPASTRHAGGRRRPYMRKGMEPALLRAYLEKYRANYGPVATKKGIENVSTMLLAGKTIPNAVPYEQIVATDFMPREVFATRKTR